MKPLRPMTILAVGPPLVGVAVSAVAAILVPGVCTVRGILIWIVTGVIFGAVILTPIATVEAFRPRLVYLLGPYAYRIWWSVSLSMAVAFGYILAVMRRGGVDGFFWLAIVVLFIGALLKMAMQESLYKPGNRSALRNHAAVGQHHQEPTEILRGRGSNFRHLRRSKGNASQFNAQIDSRPLFRSRKR